MFATTEIMLQQRTVFSCVHFTGYRNFIIANMAQFRAHLFDIVYVYFILLCLNRSQCGHGDCLGFGYLLHTMGTFALSPS